jgi:phospholipid/cholesterol/gamma-HCH transport system permease protein
MSEKEKGIMNLLDLNALKAQPLITEKRHPGIIGRIGKASLSIFSDLGSVISFAGELTWDIVLALRHPLSIRWGEVLLYMKRVGVDGLPILSLISFLLGLIMAFMSSLQLKQLGANVYVASLVCIAMVRELGPIMTAIVVAGRSGSAFAAEIGTMKVNEEVDALITMSFNPIKFLAIPKVFAAMFVVPLLTLFADIFAIMGGMVVGVLGLNLTLHTYVQQTFRALDLFNMIAGIIKSVVFGIVIAGIGCQRGFQVRGGAEEVGVATTSAVVSALFLIIVIDSVFAIVLYYI